MNPIPDGSELGLLQIGDIYYAYDGPRVFSVESGAGQIYMALFVDEDDASETYLYVPMTRSRFIAVRSGGISLREAILGSEDLLWEVRWTYEGGVPSQCVTSTSRNEVPERWLPHETARLNLVSHTQELFSEAALRERSAQEKRNLIALRFVSEDRKRTEFSTRKTVGVIHHFQEVVDALGQDTIGKSTEAGPIPGNILDLTDTDIVELRAASFVVVLAQSNKIYSMFDDQANVVTAVFESIQAASSAQEFGVRVSALGRRSRARLLGFFKAVLVAKAELGLTLAVPGEPVRTTSIGMSVAQSAVGILEGTIDEQETLAPFDAILMGVGRSRSFDVDRVSDGKQFKGQVAKSAREDLLHGLTIGDAYTISLRREIRVNQASGEEQESYLLLDIHESADPLRNESPIA